MIQYSIMIQKIIWPVLRHITKYIIPNNNNNNRRVDELAWYALHKRDRWCGVRPEKPKNNYLLHDHPENKKKMHSQSSDTEATVTRPHTYQRSGCTGT